MTSGSNAQTIVLMAVIGGFVALVEKSGGARAFARAISNKLTKPVSAQIACWLGGLAIYFSDSGNSLILRYIFRPVFDKLKVSRAAVLHSGLHLLSGLHPDPHHRLGRVCHEHHRHPV